MDKTYKTLVNWAYGRRNDEDKRELAAKKRAKVFLAEGDDCKATAVMAEWAWNEVYEAVGPLRDALAMALACDPRPEFLLLEDLDCLHSLAETYGNEATREVGE